MMNYSRFAQVCVYLMISFASIGQNDILLRIGKNPVPLSEFKYVYEKNNAGKADYSAASLDEYINLYTKFKLKVEKARQMQLDTISALKSELQGYRKQLAASYLIDKGVTDFLMKELYERMKYDVAFSHIFIPVAETATKTDRDAAIAKLKEAKAKITGGMSFEEAARLYSQDKTTAVNGGDMGHYTAKMPNGFYDLETALYTMELNSVSDVIKTRIGYHLVKLTDKRVAVGTVEVAHIVVAEDKKLLADSLFKLVNAGADWDDLAFKFSIDKKTSHNGGKLAPFGLNTYEKSFENTSFFLTESNRVSPPVMTKNGWHIIKLINKIKPDTYDIFVKKMRAQISKDQRFDAAKYSLISDIKKTAGAKEDKSLLPAFVALLAEDFYTFNWTPADNISTKAVYTLGGDRIYSLSDFAKYCKSNTKTRLKYDKAKPLAEAVDELFIEFTNDKAIEFEESNLEVKYPDFKSLLREYDEGILLFEATKLNVWDRANTDSIGLEKFYKANPGRYQWPQKAEVSEVIINTKDPKLANKIWSVVKSKGVDAAMKKFNKKSKVITSTTREYEKNAKEMSGLAWTPGDQLTLNKDSSAPDVYTFKRVNKIIQQRPKTLEEARGYVVADYQDYLEKQWVESLEKEFPVVIYKDVYSKIVKP